VSGTSGLFVDPTRFTGEREMNEFESGVLQELRAVTGMDLSFSSHHLVSSDSAPSGGSATARQVLRLAMNGRRLYLDPRGTNTERGGNVELGDDGFRGVWIDVRPNAVQLLALRPGIIIIHELAHIYADALRPAGYDTRMRAVRARAEAGTATPDELDELSWYRVQGDPADQYAGQFRDENIAVGIERSIQAELGVAQRMHYAVPIDYPPGHRMSVGQFRFGSRFIYLDTDTYDVYTSTQDLFAAGAAIHAPATPDATFRRVRPGSPEYEAIRSQLL
jgi:hypothetical protein